MIGVYVPGYGHVTLRITGVTDGFDADGNPVMHVHIAPDFSGGGPGGGEPLPLADAA